MVKLENCCFVNITKNQRMQRMVADENRWWILKSEGEKMISKRYLNSLKGPPPQIMGKIVTAMEKSGS